MKKRVTVWILLAALLAGLLTGCGEDAAEAEHDAFASKYAYQAEYLDLTVNDGGQFQGVDLLCVSGSSVFFLGSCLTGETALLVNEATGEPMLRWDTGEQIERAVSETALYRMDLETGDTVRIGTYQPADPPEGMQGSSLLTDMFAGLDGTFWIMEDMNTYSYKLPEDFDEQKDRIENYYVTGEQIQTLSQYDADGQRLKTVYLSGLSNQIIDEIMFDSDGNIYVSTLNGTFLLDAGGTLLAQLSGSFIYQRSEEEVGGIVYNASTGLSFFQTIDPEAGRYGEETTLPGNASNLYPGFGEYQYLYEDYAGIVYGCLEETGEFEKVFSWLECDLDQNAIDRVSVLENGDLVAVTAEIQLTDAGQLGTDYTLIYLRQMDPSELPQKQELTLACMSLSSEVSAAVLQFNRTHSDVRIVVKDYSTYNTADDMTAGLTRLNTELLSGNIPDLLYSSGLPMEQYAANGFLIDLWPLIDSDEDFDREDLMTHFFDTLSTDGKLYQVTSSFSIWTAVGDAGVIGDRASWTLEEMLEAAAAMPEDSTIFDPSCTKNEVLSLCVSRNLNQFINWEDHTCSFDSPEFLEILNFANSFLAEYSEDNSETEYERFMTGRQLLSDCRVGTFDSMQHEAAVVGGDPCYVGYPSSYGSGNVFRISSGLAMTAACQDQDLGWSFLRTFLTEEYQTANDIGLETGSSPIYGFPTNRNVFETLVERQRQMRQTGIPMSYESGGVTVLLTPVTQEDYDTFMSLYESCGSVSMENDIVYPIVAAEAAPFFDGQKTAEEAAALIQNRVGLYVMEQK